MNWTLASYCLALSLFLSSMLSAQDKSSLKEINLSDTINGIYIPKDIKDCFSQLDAIYPDSLKNKARLMADYEFASGAHFGLGMWIRNNWGLWQGSRLKTYFARFGYTVPDATSSFILFAYHRYLNGKDLKGPKMRKKRKLSKRRLIKFIREIGALDENV